MKNLPRVDFVTNARVGVAVVCDQPRVDFVTNARRCGCRLLDESMLFYRPMCVCMSVPCLFGVVRWQERINFWRVSI